MDKYSISIQNLIHIVETMLGDKSNQNGKIDLDNGDEVSVFTKMLAEIKNQNPNVVFDEAEIAKILGTENFNSNEDSNADTDTGVDQEETNDLADASDSIDVNTSNPIKSADEQSEQTEKTAFQINEEMASSLDKDIDDALNNYGTAAFNLRKKIDADLSINASGNLFAEQYSKLEQELSSKAKEGTIASDLYYKKEALYDLQKDYAKEHSDRGEDLIITKEISYGKNGEKKALMSQSFKLNGNNAFKPSNTQDSEDKPTSNNENDEGDKGSDDSGSNNSASATVSYNIDFKTLNGKDKGNWHIIGTVNAGSENSDIQGALQYTKTFKNDSSINFTGNLRETIEGKDNTGSYGASLDYRLKKFSTGGYAVYYHKEVEGLKEKEHYIEMYGKYGNSFFANAGVKHYNDLDYKYVKGLIQGKRELMDGCLTLKGGIGAEYGIYDNGNDNLDEKELILKAKGGVSFKSKDLNADLSAIATVGKNKTYYMDYEPVTAKTTTIGILGKVETKNFNITTALSTLKVDEKGVDEDLKADSRTTVMAQVVIGLKNLFGKNIMPILKYNVGNYDGASQNLGVGVIVTP